ncbi:hypothetical protein F2B00_31520 [Streptomyces parvus]|nr:hypothetical protein F2B00_31520 [Streptomyces parvus]
MVLLVPLVPLVPVVLLVPLVPLVPVLTVVVRRRAMCCLSPACRTGPVRHRLRAAVMWSRSRRSTSARRAVRRPP